MKKLFLTLLSVVTVASVSAQPYHLIPIDDVNINLPAISGNIPAIELGNKAISTRVPETNLVGNWSFAMGDYFLGDSPSGSILDLSYTAEIQDSGSGYNFLLFQGPAEDPYFTQPPFAGLFDETSNTLTFPIASIGMMAGYYIYQFAGIWNWEEGDATWQEVEAEYDPKTGFLTLPENTILAWPAYADPGGQTMLGYFNVYMVIEGMQEGIDGVEGLLDDFNDQPVYYNLQGMKVINPQKNQLVIEKKGKNSRKVVF